MADHRLAQALFALLLVPLMGCDGCLHLDDYRLVPPGYVTSSSGGSAGSGGSPDNCDPTAGSGRLFATVPLAPAEGASTEPGCEIGASSDGAIDVLLLDAGHGSCVGRARLGLAATTVVDSPARIGRSFDDGAVVAGTFRGGSLVLPLACGSSSTVSLDEEPGATDTMFVVKLRFDAATACTAWTSRAWTTDGLPLRVDSAQLGADGSVAVAGSLGGATVELGGPVKGNAFFARFSASGDPEVRVFEGSVQDAMLGVSSVEARWLVSGALRVERPSCHGCVGSQSVVDAAGVCSTAGGAGGLGGAGGAGGGGAGGSGGVGGVAPDSHNAFLWHLTPIDNGCARVGTFGSDRLGASDAQAGYSASAVLDAGTCVTYFGGFAGADVWRLSDAQPSSALFDAGGATGDGFVAGFLGSDDLDCGVGATHQWNLRLTPSVPGALAWTNRVRAFPCHSGLTAAVRVDTAAGGVLHLHRCEVAGCSDDSQVLLTGATSQLVVLGLNADGRLGWAGALGPVAAAPMSLDGVTLGRPVDDLVVDGGDEIALLLEIDGDLASENVDFSSCSGELEPGAPPGSYLMSLYRSGLADQARCRWARRLR